jgi:hypothetical protein
VSGYVRISEGPREHCACSAGRYSGGTGRRSHADRRGRGLVGGSGRAAWRVPFGVPPREGLEPSRRRPPGQRPRARNASGDSMRRRADPSRYRSDHSVYRGHAESVYGFSVCSGAAAPTTAGFPAIRGLPRVESPRHGAEPGRRSPRRGGPVSADRTDRPPVPNAEILARALPARASGSGPAAAVAAQRVRPDVPAAPRRRPEPARAPDPGAPGTGGAPHRPRAGRSWALMQPARSRRPAPAPGTTGARNVSSAARPALRARPARAEPPCGPGRQPGGCAGGHGRRRRIWEVRV